MNSFTEVSVLGTVADRWQKIIPSVVLYLNLSWYSFGPVVMMGNCICEVLGLVLLCVYLCAWIFTWI